MPDTRKPFLALTALEEFWDESGELIHLGPWCVNYRSGNSASWAGSRFARSPWNGPPKLAEACSFVHALYEHLLPPLGEALNSVHNRKYSSRYWRIFIGPWLRFYLTVLYERYRCLETALEDYPDFHTIGLAEENWITPPDTQGFMSSVKGDAYNLQIYTRILLALGCEIPRKALSTPAESEGRTTPSASLRQVAKESFRSLYTFALRHGFGARRLITQSPYFSRKFLSSLMLKTRLEMVPSIALPNRLSSCRPDPGGRARLKLASAGSGEFEQVVSTLLPNDIPQCFVEGFTSIVREAEEKFPSHPAAIFTANDWYYHEAFKHWAATSAEAGALLIGVQHGGNYGIIDFLPAEQHEISITDRFYSWGWERRDCSAQIVPFSAPKLSGRSLLNASNREEGILLVATSVPRYPYVFRMMPKQFVEYLDWQFRFAAAIAVPLRDKLRVRPHREDQGWDLVAQWEGRMPQVRIESWDRPFLESLERCRLYVCDHLSTTFIEALAVNKPTLLFWNREDNPLRPAAEPYFDELRASGILWHCPEGAAAAVSAVYDDIESWWTEPARQAARRRFCDRFALASSNALEEWAAELRALAQTGQQRIRAELSAKSLDPGR